MTINVSIIANNFLIITIILFGSNYLLLLEGIAPVPCDREVNRQENANSEQEHCSSGRRHVLEDGVQDGEADRAGYIYNITGVFQRKSHLFPEN